MNNKSNLYVFFFSILILVLGSGFSTDNLSSKAFTSTSLHLQFTPYIFQVEDDPNEDICSLYEAECDEAATLNAKNFEIELTRAEKAQVNAIFFWMQDCAHCEKVINSLLPEMYLTFGEKVYFFPIELKEISEIDVFYQMAGRLGVPKNNIGVPLIIIGDQVLAGNQIENNLEKSIKFALNESPYKFTAIPEFADKLPDFLQDKQTNQTTETNSSLRSPLPLGLVIGLPLLVITGAVVFFVSKKTNPR